MKSNSSNLEQFIQNHRESFDIGEPDVRIWPRIEKALDRSGQSDRLEQYILLNRSLFDTAPTPEATWNKIGQALADIPTSSCGPLEAFIRENRAAFDSDTPDLRVWAAIEQAVPAKSAKVIRVHWSKNLLRAAASVALLVTGICIGIWYAKGDVARHSGMAMSDVSTEYAEIEQFYKRDITAKQQKLATLVSYSDQALNDDLLQMDKVMSELRQELAAVPPGNRKQVVRAMIENYKAKSAILERVLEHLEQQQPATTNSGNHEVEKI